MRDGSLEHERWLACGSGGNGANLMTVLTYTAVALDRAPAPW